MNITFLIRSLDVGGAERQLASLARGLQENGHCVAVAVFYSGGGLERDLEGTGVELVNLEKRGRWDLVGFFLRAVKFLKSHKIDVLHSYLPGANIIATLAGRTTPEVPVVWAVAASNMDMSEYDLTAKITYWLEAKLSKSATLIISNSESSLECAVARGFPRDKMIVLPNPHDIDAFKYDIDGRSRVRREWGVDDEEILIGTVARFDVMKDHPNFVRAAGLISSQHKNLRFTCIGKSDLVYLDELKQLAIESGVGDKFIWPGPRADMADVYSALDISTCSSSFGEGLPNAIGEAMSCQTPCVVTDVGDCARIVGDTGVVVLPRSAEALADGWSEMIARMEVEGDSVGLKARERIVNEFSKDRAVYLTDIELEKLTKINHT